MDKISFHISYKEATRSGTAKRFDIDNSPTEFQLMNMKMVAETCFEPLRFHHGKPIFVSSFMRSKELNEHPAIKGSKTSQHMQGLYSKEEEGAIDLDADVYDNGITNKEIFHWLKENIEFDQLIWEFGDNKNPAWVHASFRKGGNRKQLLIAYKNEHGRTKYKAYHE